MNNIPICQCVLPLSQCHLQVLTGNGGGELLVGLDRTSGLDVCPDSKDGGVGQGKSRI